MGGKVIVEEGQKESSRTAGQKQKQQDRTPVQTGAGTRMKRKEEESMRRQFIHTRAEVRLKKGGTYGV